MTTSEIFTLVNIILTASTFMVAFFNYRHSRKKDFQDKLYHIKIEAYKDINEKCYSACSKLDVNSTPFVQIYEIEKQAEWEKYFIKEVTKMHQVGFTLQKEVYQYVVFIPSEIAEKIHNFSNLCIGYVTNYSHFDTGSIINLQDKLWDLYVELVEAMRNDLKIKEIDGGLLMRITNKIV